MHGFEEISLGVGQKRWLYLLLGSGFVVFYLLGRRLRVGEEILSTKWTRQGEAGTYIEKDCFVC